MSDRHICLSFLYLQNNNRLCKITCLQHLPRKTGPNHLVPIVVECWFYPPSEHRKAAFFTPRARGGDRLRGRSGENRPTHRPSPLYASFSTPPIAGRNGMEWKEQMTQKGTQRNLPQKGIPFPPKKEGTQKFLLLHKFMVFSLLVGCSSVSVVTCPE